MVSPDFIIAHENDDLATLVLQRDRWPDVDVALAAECIASRRKLKLKVPEWYADPALICPVALSAEQCSSTATAAHKAAIAGSSLPCGGAMPGLGSPCGTQPGPLPLADGPERRTARIADLTGGLGVDSWQFSKVAAAVLYNEMNPLLFETAKANLGRLGCDNVEFSNICISPDTLPGLLDSFRPDLVFIDPARRSEGRKVFLPEDCSPDVLALQDIILKRGCRLMLKLSPMADISLLLRKFHCVKELHVVEADGECKELLLVQEPGFDGECTVFVEIVGQAGSDGQAGNDEEQGGRFSFKPSEEKVATATFISTLPAPGQLLFEPGPALMKSGAFNLLSARFELRKLGPSTHLYISDNPLLELIRLGKWFAIEAVEPFGKAALRDFATLWPDAEVSARALPLSSDELRKKMGVKGGGDVHIFGVGTSQGRLLIAASKATLDLR
ncbi:MAG: hypothetical protein IKZ60_07085 [Bacteroidales bacterium]|nr:hypothetical protein [Bacteroidales bacterium]